MAFPLFSKPVQRQRWGDQQFHPVINWGDLFFDLFYVAAAYNLSTIIRESPSGLGLMYFAVCFWSVYNLWWDRTYYDARFYTGDDLWHHCIEVISLCVLATAVLHIRSVAVLSNPTEKRDMFVLCLSLTMGKFLSAGRYLEMLVWVEGQPVAKVCARREIIMMTPILVFSMTATIYAGLQYDPVGGHRFLAGGESSPYSYESKSPTTNIPIILLLSGGLTYTAAITFFIFTLPSGGRHKEVTVPLNVDFVIHRYGEWTMLVLGESILSLLIVEVIEGSHYYVTFYSGILSVVLLQVIHFRSQPAHADDHALRRSKEAGVSFSLLMTVYSAALVLLGVSYKMLLYEFVYEPKGGGRFLFKIPRWLAGGGGALQYDTEDRRQRIANFFGGSMAIVWFCSDALILVHRGIKANVGRCTCIHTKKVQFKGVFLVIVRAGLIAAAATMSLYETDPERLALFGLAGIILQLMLRITSSIMFPDDLVLLKQKS